MMHRTARAISAPPLAPLVRRPAHACGLNQIASIVHRGLDPLILSLTGATALLRDAQDLCTDAGFSLLLAVLLLPFVLDWAGAYDPPGHRKAWAWRPAALGIALLFGGVLGAALVTGGADPALRAGGLFWFLGTLGGCLAARSVVSLVTRRLAAPRWLQPRTALVSFGTPDPQLVHEIARTTRLQGRFDARTGDLRRALTSLDGTLDDVVALGQRRPLDCVIVALPPHADGQLPAILHRLKSLAVDVVVAPPRLDLAPVDASARDGLAPLAA